MFKTFYPDTCAQSTYEIDFEEYYKKGYRAIIFDIDNTLVEHGVKADERSYAYIAQQLNKEGHTVIIPNIPLHMAVYGPEQGLAIMEDNPQIEKWFLIGHSLGGLPISQIAAEQPEKLEGVAFVASLMILDLSNTDISAIRITAVYHNHVWSATFT